MNPFYHVRQNEQFEADDQGFDSWCYLLLSALGDLWEPGSNMYACPYAEVCFRLRAYSECHAMRQLRARLESKVQGYVG